MTTPEEHKRQIEAGKGIVKELLCALAPTLYDSRVAEFKSIETHLDFDHHEGQLSLFDPTTEKIVTKLKVPDLADAPATSIRKKHLEDRVRAAVIAFRRRNEGDEAN